MVRWPAMLIALTLAIPATAQAAVLRVENGVLEYTATPGKVSNVVFTEPAAGTIVATRGAEDDDPIVVGTDCTGNGPYVCTGVTSGALDAGDMSDRLQASSGTPEVGIAVPLTMLGGDGNDALVGGARGDRLEGGAGDDNLDGSPGNDALAGGEGNDILQPDTGTDTMVGGDGVDTAVYGRRVSPAFSLDGLANDGAIGEGDLIGADVEGIEAAADDVAQTVTITGDGRANRLRSTLGKAAITGGEGADFIEGGPQDDTLTSRDGSPDYVVCNAGLDTVIADTLDTIAPSCEVVQTQAAPGGPFDDRPPSIAWTTPAAGASLSAGTATTLSVDATDDRAVMRVQFLDDDRVVCEDSEPPYACSYQPRGGDVGRNTLIAVAVDGANQTTSIVRPVTVRRFDARHLSVTLRPARDRRAPYTFRASGRVLRPDIVSPSQGCSGTVTLTARRGSKVVSTKRARVSRVCEYTATFKFRTRTASRLRIRARFGGNDVLSTKTSSTRTARLG